MLISRNQHASSPVPTHDGGGHQCSSVAISMQARLCQLSIEQLGRSSVAISMQARLCQLSVEQLGRQVMLVQPHSEGFRIDSDELRHGVL
jgi:hypothetical protein